jgi:hypothetical protein
LDVVGIYGETDGSINIAWHYEVYRRVPNLCGNMYIERKQKKKARDREEKRSYVFFAVVQIGNS